MGAYATELNFPSAFRNFFVLGILKIEFRVSVSFIWLIKHLHIVFFTLDEIHVHINYFYLATMRVCCHHILGFVGSRNTCKLKIC
jgi:hypothetical protein